LNQPLEVITGTLREVKQMKQGIIAALLAIGLAFGMNSTALAQAAADEAPPFLPKDIPVAPVDPKTSSTIKISLLESGKDVCNLTLVESQQGLLGGVADCTKSTVAGGVLGSSANAVAYLGTSNSAFALEIQLFLAKSQWDAVVFTLKGTRLSVASGTFR
jgi:hypothetical protein